MDADTTFMWVLGYRWGPVESHDWQCQRVRVRGGRCRAQTVDRFTPVCEAHLLPEVENMARVVEAAYNAGVVTGAERIKSSLAMQRRWNEMVAGSSLEAGAEPATDDGLADQVNQTGPAETVVEQVALFE